MLVVEIIEPIEVSLRTSIAYHLAHQAGAFAHKEAKSFRPEFQHADWLEDILTETQRSQEVFVKHFKDNYEEYPHLPVWTAVEIMSFGSLSKLFSGLPMADKQVIASQYGIKAPVLKSWLHTLVYIRNLCAHHARLWNRELGIAPMLPDKDPRWNFRHRKRLVSALHLLNWLVSRVPRREAVAADWRRRVETLLEADPGVPRFLEAMGLEVGWEKHALWRGA